MSPWLWVRCIAVGALMLAGFLVWFGWAYPGMPHGIPIGTMALGLAAIPGMLAVQIGLMALAPTRVSITAKRIHISHGSSAFIIKPDRLVDVAVEFDEHERPMLRMSYRVQRLRKSKPEPERTRVHAIGSKVDLVELEEMLTALMARRSGGGSGGEPQVAQIGPDQTEHLGVSG